MRRPCIDVSGITGSASPDTLNRRRPRPAARSHVKVIWRRPVVERRNRPPGGAANSGVTPGASVGLQADGIEGSDSTTTRKIDESNPPPCCKRGAGRG